VSKPGERDDTLPPDHRFREEGHKVTFASPLCIKLQYLCITKDVTNFPLVLQSSPQASEAAKPKDVKPKQVLYESLTIKEITYTHTVYIYIYTHTQLW